MINRRHSNIQAYCSEDISHIENYQEAVNDKEHMWECHHKLEVQGQFRNSKELLKRCGMYWHRPACELIFLRHDEHRRLHMSGNKYCLGMKLSDETKRKMSESSLTKKKVEMKRKSDGFTMTFPSQSEAVRWLRLNGHPKATTISVSQCANGHRATAYNANWRYL